jgi:hypothetical protein
VPMADWFREEKGLGRLVRELFSDHRNEHIFKEESLSNLLTEHKSGVRDHSEFLWSATNFILWKDLYNVL